MVLGGLATGAAGGIGINIVIRAIDNFSKTFALAQTQVAGLSGFIQKHKTGIMLAGAAITGVTAAIATSSINAFTEFNFQIQRAGANVNATAETLERFKKTAIDAVKGTEISATEAAAGLAFLAGGSVSADEAMTALGPTIDFARANMMDLQQATLVSSQAMVLFGVDAENVSSVLDLLTKAGQVAYPTSAQLADSFQEVGSIAAQLGINLVDLTAILGVMGDAGIIGSEAGVALKRAFTILASPTKQTIDGLTELGLTVDEVQSLLHDPIALLKLLETRLTKIKDPVQKLSALSKIFGQLAGPSMSALLGMGTEAIEDMKIELENADGTLEDVIDRVNSAVSPFEELKRSTEALKLSLGEALIPTFRILVDILKPVLDLFTRLPGPVQAIFVLGGLLTGVILLLTPAILALTPAMIAATGAATGLGAALTLLGGFGLIALTIGFSISAITEDDFKSALMKAGMAGLFAGAIAFWLFGGTAAVVVGLGTLIVVMGIRWLFKPPEKLTFEEQLNVEKERIDKLAEVGRWTPIIPPPTIDMSNFTLQFDEGTTKVANFTKTFEGYTLTLNTTMDDLIKNSTRIPTITGVVHDLGESIGSPVKGSYPVVYALLQAEIEWRNMSSIAVLAIQEVIAELNKIPKEIVTTHRIETVGGGGGNLFGFNIPFFQTGGIMPYTGLAYLHKGETVTPARESNSGGITIYIENVNGLDADMVAEALQDKLNTMIST